MGLALRGVKILILTFLCIQITFKISLGQEGVYPVKWLPNGVIVLKLDGKQQVTQYFRFEDASYIADYIPVYSAKLLIKSDEKEYYVTDLNYQTIPDSLLDEVYIPEVLPLEAIHLHTHTSHNGKRYLSVRAPSIRRNKSDNSLERLISFEINSRPRSEVERKNIQQHNQEKSANSSLLATGYWYKVKVTKSGIYKLTYSDIVGMGFSDPGNIRIFGQGGKQLSYLIDDPRLADMVEIPLFMEKGGDGVFNEGDFVLFYAEGPVTWRYDTVKNIFKQKLHGYSNAICYFLTTSHGTAKEIVTIDNRNLNSNTTVNSYDDYSYYEKENYNLIGSGRNWYSIRFSEDPFDTTFSFPNLVPNSTIKIVGKAAGRSVSSRAAHLLINDQEVLNFVFQSIYNQYSWQTYASDDSFYYEYISSSNQQRVELTYDKVEVLDLAFLDYITVNARSEMVLSNTPLLFRDMNSVGESKIVNYIVRNATSNTLIWDISDLNNTFAIQGEFNAGEYHFKASSEELRQYIAFNVNGNFPSPIADDNSLWVGEVPNQNLRALPVYQYIIVTHEAFLDQAERLAEHRRTKNGLSVLVVTPEMIYNEFSSGTPDISAIRDFLRHQYLKSNGDDSLKYVLLFGDGSYNNHMYTSGNTNYILTYQSPESLSPTASYVSDDFFGYLGEGEGGFNDDDLDIGIGRLTVKLNDGNNYEAEDVVNKIIAYDTCKFADWRKELCFVGDDGYDPGGIEEGTKHMASSDRLAQFVENKYDGFDFSKIYLDAYPQVNTASGSTYPEANRELENLFNRGILVFTYSGHGSENQITGERILEKQDVIGMDNSDFLPLFITATCQFSRYDHVMAEEADVHKIIAKTSLGEEALINPKGGASALLGTSRVVYSDKNEELVREVLNYLFDKDSAGNPYLMGDVIRMAKNNLGDQTNKLNFTLLGDPAMRLAYPEFRVCTDSVNGVSVDQELDTLKAFSLINISGHVAWDDSTIMDNFNGFVYPHVYDKKSVITTFGNDNQPPFTFETQTNLLYRGKATVTNGRFRFSFVVPKDISYNLGYGKVSYYAENGQTDAKGEYLNVLVGGTNEDNADRDFTGPQIDLFMNDNRFIDGGITDTDPFIYAELFDEMGINTSGVGIGHDIVAILDDDYQQPLILNDYYEANVDDYQSGKVRFQLRDLKEGEHQLAMKVWDVYNNSSEASISFVVRNGGGLILESVYCYPNPADEYTSFIYQHNAPDENHEVTIEIFDISGRLVHRINETRYESGFISMPLTWNFRTTGNNRLGAGVYPYRLTVKTSKGIAYINQKLIILQ